MTFSAQVSRALGHLAAESGHYVLPVYVDQPDPTVVRFRQWLDPLTDELTDDDEDARIVAAFAEHPDMADVARQLARRSGVLEALGITS